MTAINAALLLSLKSSTCRLGRGQAPYAHEDADPRLRSNARGSDGGVREELAAGVNEQKAPHLSGQNLPTSLEPS
jgi:hypothetical protein